MGEPKKKIRVALKRGIGELQIAVDMIRKEYEKNGEVRGISQEIEECWGLIAEMEGYCSISEEEYEGV